MPSALEGKLWGCCCAIAEHGSLIFSELWGSWKA